MKRKRGLRIAAAAVVISVVWWLLPTKITNIEPEEVAEIQIFDGNTGRVAEVSDEEAIEHVINNLNNVSIVKSKISLLYMGYAYDMTIYKTNGDVYKRFIINSESVVRKDPFFYEARSSDIDWDYITSLVGSGSKDVYEKRSINFLEGTDVTLEPSNASQIVNREALPDEMPEDFELVLKYGVESRNVIDTFSNEVTKDLIDEGTESVPYEMDEDLKTEIYDELVHICIEQYPAFFQSPYKRKDIKGREVGGLSHYSTYILEYRINGESYKVTWEDEYPGESIEDIMGDELRKVLMHIIKYVEGTEEYKSLPEPSGGYV